MPVIPRDRAHAGVPPGPAVAGVAQQRQTVGRCRQRVEPRLERARRLLEARAGERGDEPLGPAVEQRAGLIAAPQREESGVEGAELTRVLEGRRAVVVRDLFDQARQQHDRGAVERALDLVERRRDARPRREHQQALVLAEQQPCGVRHECLAQLRWGVDRAEQVKLHAGQRSGVEHREPGLVASREPVVGVADGDDRDAGFGVVRQERAGQHEALDARG